MRSNPIVILERAVGSLEWLDCHGIICRSCDPDMAAFGVLPSSYEKAADLLGVPVAEIEAACERARKDGLA